VRDDLDGLPEVVAVPLLVNDRSVHLPRRDVIVPRQAHVEEPLVVPEVEVDLRAVVEDEDLAVLVRVHRARVHVQVRVDLDGDDLQSARLQQDAEARRRDALPEAGHHAPRDDNELHVVTGMSHCPHRR